MKARQALESHILYINPWAKDLPFGGLIDISHSMGKMPLKTPHFWDENRDFQLRLLAAYLGTEGLMDHNAQNALVGQTPNVRSEKLIGLFPGSNLQKVVSTGK
jgi:hypothetical protein